MNEGDPRSEVVRYWWSRAHDSLASARRELGAGALAFAVNRRYYALFYATSAALLERGLSYSRHSAVRAALHREFVRSGLIPVLCGRTYDRLFDDRHESDYIPLVEFDRVEVTEQIRLCEEFLATIKPLIRSVP